MSKSKFIEIRKNILKKNDDLAQGLRSRFGAAGVYVVNCVSSPGTGKTELLQRFCEERRAVYEELWEKGGIHLAIDSFVGVLVDKVSDILTVNVGDIRGAFTITQPM